MNYVGVVITSYNDSDAVSVCISSVKKSGVKNQYICVVDDGSDQNVINNLRKITRGEGVVLIEKERNTGIADSLNRGVLFFESNQEIKSILFLDQDSEVTEKMLEVLLMERKINHDETIKIIAPNIFEKKLKILERPKINVFSKDCITSGSLIDKHLFRDIGYFDTHLFIDFVDKEFCLRARKNGYKILVIGNAILKHSIGNLEEKNFLRIKFFYSKHSPERVYYFIRNGFYVSIKYFFFDPAYSIGILVTEIKEITKIVFFERDTRYYKSLYFGVRDFLRGRLGKL